MKFIDAHSHYNDEQFDDDLDEVIKRTKNEGITKIICAGYDIHSSKKSIEISSKYDFIYSTCGISPNDVPENLENIDELMKELETLAINKKIIAIGEIGLDYHWNTENKEIQKEFFIRQIELANKYDLPIQIHTREAVMDTIQILKEHPVKRKGMFHCCPLNRELVKEALKLGFYISFAGTVTFKNSKNAEEIVNMVPLNRIITETDSPYLAPEPKRGTRNECMNVKHIVQKIADFKNISIEEVAEQTYNNVLDLFGKISNK
ncbi:MAG: TatD family hydrolase [Clostridia bacterium]|nr:TatD family hydrolase [Clostridia bacterium]